MANLLYVHNADFSKPCANRIQVLNMCKAFKKIEQSITLIGFNCTPTIIKNVYGERAEFDMISLSPHGNYYIRSLLLFLMFLKIKKGYDWIYTRDLLFAFLVSTFCHKKKVIYELHDASKNKIWYFLFKKTFKKLHYCVVISRGINKELINLGFDPDKIYVLHDGVDLEKFNINLSKEEARDILKLPKNKTIVTYTGSLQNWKGYSTFLDSYNYLKNRENTIYLLVGGTKDQVNKLMEAHKNKNITFISFVENSKIPIFLKASDILVIPHSSKYKIALTYTSPLKLFEYMASKKPIVSTDLPSIKDVVTKNHVLFFKADNAEDLALKIEKLISDKKLQQKLAKNAFNLVKHYTWEKRAKKIIKIFKS